MRSCRSVSEVLEDLGVLGDFDPPIFAESFWRLPPRPSEGPALGDFIPGDPRALLEQSLLMIGPWLPSYLFTKDRTDNAVKIMSLEEYLRRYTNRLNTQSAHLQLTSLGHRACAFISLGLSEVDG